LDVAAGTGGFCLALKQRRGAQLEVTASDLCGGYLEAGAQQARAAGLEVQFRPLDALKLDGLSPGSFDIVTCTQSLHHFSAGVAARLLAQCARLATTGVCFIDGERGLPPLVTMAPLMALYGRDWPVVHDTIVSIRRMYLAEEMQLLAALVPHPLTHCAVRCERFGPGHAYIMLRHLPTASAPTPARGGLF
ncbi:MAG: class I SAM-dependent methyltransferase, partial [Oxalobacteraceae bacterium]